MKWHEPKDIKDWIQRGISLRLGLALVAMFILVVTEVRLNWLEKVVGAYLVTTNADRPESGAIWELGHQNQNARKNLAEIVGEDQVSRQEARSAANFAEVLSGLSEDNGVSISSVHFRKLYDKLPAVLSQELLSPYTLLQVEAQGDWVRTYFTKSDGEVRIYLLDRDNQVIKEVAISQDLADYIRQGEVAVQGKLSSFADFSENIFPPDLFFNVLETLPEEQRRGILPQPQMLLNSKGKLINVGISSEEVGGSIAIGFEYEDGGTHKVILVQGKKEEVERLRQRLFQRSSSDVETPKPGNFEGGP